MIKESKGTTNEDFQGAKSSELEDLRVHFVTLKLTR